MPGLLSGPCPIVRFYGVTMEGNSVLCHVHGFLPYFYVPAPPNFSPDECEKFRSELDKIVLADMRSNKDNVTSVSVQISFYIYFFPKKCKNIGYVKVLFLSKFKF